MRIFAYSAQSAKREARQNRTFVPPLYRHVLQSCYGDTPNLARLRVAKPERINCDELELWKTYKYQPMTIRIRPLLQILDCIAVHLQRANGERRLRRDASAVEVQDVWMMKFFPYIDLLFENLRSKR